MRVNSPVPLRITPSRAPKSSVSSSRRWQTISTGDHSAGAGRVRALSASRPLTRPPRMTGIRPSSRRAAAGTISFLPSHHDLAAVDIEGGTVDEGRGIGSEKDGGVGDLARLAEPLHGDGLGD